MADNLSDVAENLVLNYLAGNSVTDPTGDRKVALLTVLATDSTAGTEVTGGSYARKTATFTTATTGTLANDTDLIWEDMPECTVVGLAIYDSTGTPIRLWHGPLTASKDLDAGEDFKIASGDLTMSIS